MNLGINEQDAIKGGYATELIEKGVGKRIIGVILSFTFTESSINSPIFSTHIAIRSYKSFIKLNVPEIICVPQESRLPARTDGAINTVFLISEHHIASVTAPCSQRDQTISLTKRLCTHLGLH